MSKIKSAVSWARDNPQYHNYDPCVHVPMFIILVQAIQRDALEAAKAIIVRRDSWNANTFEEMAEEVDALKEGL